MIINRYSFVFDINSVRGKLEMIFPKYLGGSSFRWNDSPWGGIGRFRPSPESDWYHYRYFLSQAILTDVRISSITTKCIVILAKARTSFCLSYTFDKTGACF
jgi:hypothetical protein